MAGPRRSIEQARPFLSRQDDDDRDIELSHLDAGVTPTHITEAIRPAKPGTQSPWLVGTVLLITVLGFVINTEATEYFESELGWKKPFATMYITHGSLCLPWFCHLLYDRFLHRNVSYTTWVRQYNNELRASISTIDAYAASGPSLTFKRKGQIGGPLDYLASVMAIVFLALSTGGCSWFLALAFTTPTDLTAIFNCSTFFAALFSIPILNERLGKYSILAVALSIVGTFVIAYGDTTSDHNSSSSNTKVGTSRLFGNLVACVGALAFGLYEVLFKKYACSSTTTSTSSTSILPTRHSPPPTTTTTHPIPAQPSPQSTLPLTLAASALTGLYTLSTFWLLLLILHILGLETLEWPSLQVWRWIAVAVLSGSLSITLLAVLVVWTDPVFGSFANVLSMVFVGFADWMVFGLEPSRATYLGGGVVVVAFGVLAWETFGGKGGRH